MEYPHDSNGSGFEELWEECDALSPQDRLAWFQKLQARGVSDNVIQLLRNRAAINVSLSMANPALPLATTKAFAATPVERDVAEQPRRRLTRRLPWRAACGVLIIVVLVLALYRSSTTVGTPFIAPEMRMFDPFVGECTEQYLDFEAESQMTCSWLEGGFVFQMKRSGTVAGNPFSGTTWITYDKENNLYWLWGFDSQGGQDHWKGTKSDEGIRFEDIWYVDSSIATSDWDFSQSGRIVGHDYSEHHFPAPRRITWVIRKQ